VSSSHMSVETDVRFQARQSPDIVLVGGSTHIPKVPKLLQDFFRGKEMNKSVDHDGAVASGAAIYAAVLAGDRSEQLKDLLLIEVTSHTLGCDTSEGVVAQLISRNSAITTSQKRRITLSSDRPSVSIRVCSTTTNNQRLRPSWNFSTELSSSAIVL
jgi:L1 cell adhesion molecule like protein